MQDGGQQGGGHPTNLPHNRQPGPYLPRGWASAPWAPPRPTPSPAPAAPAAARSPAPGAGRTLQGGGGGRRGNKLRRWGVRTPAPSTQHLPAHLAPPRSSPLTSECDGHLIAAVPVGRALRHEYLRAGEARWLCGQAGLLWNRMACSAWQSVAPCPTATGRCRASTASAGPACCRGPPLGPNKKHNQPHLDRHALLLVVCSKHLATCAVAWRQTGM